MSAKVFGYTAALTYNRDLDTLGSYPSRLDELFYRPLISSMMSSSTGKLHAHIKSQSRAHDRSSDDKLLDFRVKASRGGEMDDWRGGQTGQARFSHPPSVPPLTPFVHKTLNKPTSIP